MLFPLKHLNEMERRYPGVLALMQKKPENWQQICIERNVQPGHFTGMRALMHWRQDKVCYTFEKNVAIEVFEQTADPDFKIPVTMMRHLPYPCIAIRIISFDLLDGSGISLEPYTGLAYLWCEGDRLYSAWEFDSENYKNPDEIGEYAFTSAYLELKEGLTLGECFHRSVTEKLRRKFTVVAKLK